MTDQPTDAVDDSPTREHAAELVDERNKVRAGTYGPDHDREHGSYGLAVLAGDRLDAIRDRDRIPTAAELAVTNLDSISEDRTALDRRAWVEVGQFALAALELIDTQDAELDA